MWDIYQQDTNKDQQKKNVKIKDLTPEERRNLVGFFELLIKVDKRTNPTLYKLKTRQQYD